MYPDTPSYFCMRLYNDYGKRKIKVAHAAGICRKVLSYKKKEGKKQQKFIRVLRAYSYDTSTGAYLQFSISFNVSQRWFHSRLDTRVLFILFREYTHIHLSTHTCAPVSRLNRIRTSASRRMVFPRSRELIHRRPSPNLITLSLLTQAASAAAALTHSLSTDSQNISDKFTLA